MYSFAFLLYLLGHVLIICETLKTEQYPGAEMYFEGMWLRDGGGQKPVGKSSQSSLREKRVDIIDPSLFNHNWTPDDFYGVRSEAVVSLENDGTYDGYDLKHAYGVRLQARLILTVCSAVTYVKKKDDRVTSWFQNGRRLNVTKCASKNIRVHVMTTEKYELTEIDDILIHPMCDNQYNVDLAVLVTQTPLPDSRNVWIHTAENLLFRRNLDRVVAAQGVLGKCTVPVYKMNYAKRYSYEPPYTIDFVRIQFQHWDGCRANVCPYWPPPRGVRKYQHPDRCRNELPGTRYCMAWTIPEKLCKLSAGTPIFCDVGQIHGLMGFFVQETYSCWRFHDRNGVMQALNDAIGWIRDTLTLQISPNYTESIPDWMVNLRENYTSRVRPRIKPNKTKSQSPEIGFKNFTGPQVLSVVNVYMKNDFRCRGTLVTHTLAVVPCSCITYNPRDMMKLENIVQPHVVEHYGRITDFRISLLVNGSTPYVTGHSYEPNEMCDNHYLNDSAWIELSASLPESKIAWVMTSHEELFAKMLTIVAVADSSMGQNCYWLDDSYPVNNRSKNNHKLRFVPWTRCIHSICPSNDWKEKQKDRCYGPSDPPSSTLFCVESENSKYPACDIPHGTPIFCNVEEARGFVGLISRAMDLNETPCRKRGADNQTAVFQGLDKFLPQFKRYTWINLFETQIRDFEIGPDHPDAHSKGFSRRIMLREALTVVIFIISFMMF